MLLVAIYSEDNKNPNIGSIFCMHNYTELSNVFTPAVKVIILGAILHSSTHTLLTKVSVFMLSEQSIFRFPIPFRFPNGGMEESTLNANVIYFLA